MTVIHVNRENWISEVKESILPVVVDFYTDYCGPCRILAPIIERLSEKYANRMKFVKVDAEQDGELDCYSGIITVPRLIFLVRGEFKDMVAGNKPEYSIEEKIRMYI